ncbi:MAG: hypothetical protein U9Q22_00015 [Candidatus Altiarchaeota archaeon]|nr:hypothetical protein [Candidatus Altiarchaeota archaeon]
MKNNIKPVIILIVAVLLGITSVHAQLPPEYTDDVMNITGEMKAEHPKMWMELSRRMSFYHQVSDKIDALMDFFCKQIIGLILMDPPLQDAAVINLLNYFIYLLQPVYGTAVLISGIYFIFLSTSPEGRARAKSTLLGLIIGLGVITLTLPLMQFILQIPHAIASLILSFTPGLDTNIFRIPIVFFTNYFFTLTFFESVVGAPFLVLPLILPVGALIILAARYFMIILLTAFFPFTILLYSLYPTRGVGSILLKQTIIWAFVPVIDALVLIVTWIGYSTVLVSPVPDMNVFIVLAGFLLLMLAPLITLGITNWMAGSGIVAAIIVHPMALATSYFGRMGGMDEEEYTKLKGGVQR